MTGAWGFVATDASGNCAARYGDALAMTIERLDATLVEGADGAFTLDDVSFVAGMDNLEPRDLDPLSCTTDGETFTCEAWASNRNWNVGGGRYIQDYWTLSGSWNNGGTTSVATMAGELRSVSGEPSDECSSTTLLDGAPQ